MVRSIVIWVFDGLQPSQVTPELMPNLVAFTAQGVLFKNHHSVFPTVTRTNVSSMQTGRYPGGHGLAGNNLVIREFAPYQPIPALRESLSQVKKKLGHVLLAPTLADVLGANGREYVALGIGSDGNAYLQNPNVEESGGATIHPEFCLPIALNDELVNRFGSWPVKTTPDSVRLAHAVQIMKDYVISEREPAVSLLWCSEPDTTQHEWGIGSEMSLRALTSADDQFGQLISWLDQNNRAGETDVIVVSDHGHSTITEVINIESLLRAHSFSPGGMPGGVSIATNGGAVLFYVDNHSWAVCDRLAGWLMTQPWCGSIITSDSLGIIPGTLKASLVGGEGPRAPDLAMSFSGDSLPNGMGFNGHIYSAGSFPGQGQHGSMSKHELRNFLAVRGPSFKKQLIIDTPTGNIDLMPTILEMLDISVDLYCDGRVIREALAVGHCSEKVAVSTEIHKSERIVDNGVYRQQISLSKVGRTIYVDEGKANFEVR